MYVHVNVHTIDGLTFQWNSIQEKKERKKKKWDAGYTTTWMNNYPEWKKSDKKSLYKLLEKAN